ncbi:MAG: VOC family protein [Chloroflexi bacterium]|nr:VOC family protein [Chloroflexota bacterium]
MDWRLDHVMIVVRHLERAAEAYRDLGFRVIDGGRHTGMGTENKIVRFGLDYLELLGVYSAEEASQYESRRAIMRFLETREGAFSFALAVRGLPPDAPAGEDRERARPDGTVLRWRTAYQNLLGQRPVRPFLIEWEESDAELLARYQREGEAGAHPNGAQTLTGLTVGVPHVAAARAAYESLLGTPELAGINFVVGNGIERLTIRTTGEPQLIRDGQGVELELVR